LNLFNPIKIGCNLSINVLTTMYGIDCKVYFPKNIKNLQHGYYDDDIKYGEEPDIEQKMLIPAIFSEGQTTLPGVFDQITVDEKILYVPNDLDIPKYSLIVATLNSNRILKYRVNDTTEYKDDESLIFRKYYLVPVVSYNDDDNEEDKIDEIQEQFDELEDESNFDFMLDYNNTQYKEDVDEHTKNNEFVEVDLDNLFDNISNDNSNNDFDSNNTNNNTNNSINNIKKYKPIK